MNNTKERDLEIAPYFENQNLQQLLNECKAAIELARSDTRVIRISMVLSTGDDFEYYVEENANIVKMLESEKLVIQDQLAVSEQEGK